MDIKLEVGRRYVDREGRVYGPLYAVKDSHYPFECRGSNESWMPNGDYYSDGDGSAWDLIALAPDEGQVIPETEVERIARHADEDEGASEPDELATLRARVKVLEGALEATARDYDTLRAENARLRDALEKIAKNSSDETNPDLSSQNSMGNYDDVFYDGMRQGDYYTAEIARAALAQKGERG